MKADVKKERKPRVAVDFNDEIEIWECLKPICQITEPGYCKYVAGWNDIRVAEELNKTRSASETPKVEIKKTHVARIRTIKFGITRDHDAAGDEPRAQDDIETRLARAEAAIAFIENYLGGLNPAYKKLI